MEQDKTKIENIIRILQNAEKKGNYIVESIEQVFNGSANFGRNMTFKIGRYNAELGLLDNLSNEEDISDFFINWPISNRFIDQNDHNFECPISMDIISEKETYCKCAFCSYNFSKELLMIYFKTNYNIFSEISCPMCGTHWTNKTIYINEKN